MVGTRIALAFLSGLIFCELAVAQSQPVDHQAKGPADKDIQIGTYINVKPDCTSGPLPTIRLVGPPEHGKVSVKKVNVNATNYKQCLALDVPGYVAFYRAASGFAGTDVVTLEVKFPGGRTELQKITVTVTGFGLVGDITHVRVMRATYFSAPLSPYEPILHEGPYDHAVKARD